MKIIASLFILLIAVQLVATDKAPITVKNSTVNNGVVIVTIREASKDYELQCNQNTSKCTAPKPGEYWMVRLPENYGLYDCANVDLYSQSANPDEHGQVLGEYCISEK